MSLDDKKGLKRGLARRRSSLASDETLDVGGDRALPAQERFAKRPCAAYNPLLGVHYHGESIVSRAHFQAVAHNRISGRRF